MFPFAGRRDRIIKRFATIIKKKTHQDKTKKIGHHVHMSNAGNNAEDANETVKITFLKNQNGRTPDMR